MSDYDSIDRTDWRDYATTAELEEWLSSESQADREAEAAFYEWESERFDPDDRYGDMRTEPVMFHRIAGNMYRS